MMRTITLILICSILAACETTSSSSLYYWGDYEQLLYDMYNKPGSAEPEMQIDQLSADIQKAQDSGERIAPGVHAHLGLMYASIGNMAAAEAAFNNEKLLFPESAVLLDGMLQRAYKARQKQGGSK
jgi:hypothetical protein